MKAAGFEFFSATLTVDEDGMLWRLWLGYDCQGTESMYMHKKKNTCHIHGFGHVWYTVDGEQHQVTALEVVV